MNKVNVKYKKKKQNVQIRADVLTYVLIENQYNMEFEQRYTNVCIRLKETV